MDVKYGELKATYDEMVHVLQPVVPWPSWYKGTPEEHALHKQKTEARLVQAGPLCDKYHRLAREYLAVGPKRPSRFPFWDN